MTDYEYFAATIPTSNTSPTHNPGSQASINNSPLSPYDLLSRTDSTYDQSACLDVTEAATRFPDVPSGFREESQYVAYDSRNGHRYAPSSVLYSTDDRVSSKGLYRGEDSQIPDEQSTQVRRPVLDRMESTTDSTSLQPDSQSVAGRTTNNDPLVKCKICAQTFKDMAILKKHRKEMHERDAEYFCPCVGLITKSQQGGYCAICGPKAVMPDLDHFVTKHHYGECWDKATSGTWKVKRRNGEFLKHLRSHDIGLTDGDPLVERILRFGSKKGAYGCGLCAKLLLGWGARQDHMKQHLRQTMKFVDLQWDHSMVIRNLLSQDFIAPAWKDFLDKLNSTGISPSLEWSEHDSRDLQAKLESRRDRETAPSVAALIQQAYKCMSRDSGPSVTVGSTGPVNREKVASTTLYAGQLHWPAHKQATLTSNDSTQPSQGSMHLELSTNSLNDEYSLFNATSDYFNLR